MANKMTIEQLSSQGTDKETGEETAAEVLKRHIMLN